MTRTARHTAILWGAAICVLIGVSTVAAAEPWKAPPEAEGYKNPSARDAKSIAAGKKVYEKFCYLCHGNNGDGQGPSAKALAIFPASFKDKEKMKQSDGSLAWKILYGRGPMPSWAPVLQEPDIWNVINYIRGFSQ